MRGEDVRAMRLEAIEESILELGAQPLPLTRDVHRAIAAKGWRVTEGTLRFDLATLARRGRLVRFKQRRGRARWAVA